MKRIFCRYFLVAAMIFSAAIVVSSCDDDTEDPVAYTLTTTVEPVGAGSINRVSDKEKYDAGEKVTLTATANSGYEFVGWERGGTIVFTQPSGFEVTMDADKSYTAKFTPEDGGSTTRALIAGKFASPTGSGDAVFYADYASATRSAIVRSSTDERELAGKIEDGDIVFNLRGTYNPATGMFFLSAGSSIIVYQIAGTLTNDEMIAAEASVKVKSGADEWITHTVSVTSVDNEVTIDGEVSTEQEDGLPTSWFGTWAHTYENCHYSEGNLIECEDATEYFTLTSFQLISIEDPNMLPAGFLDIVSLGNNRYEMVWEMWNEWCNGYSDGRPDECGVDLVYGKVVAEMTASALNITLYGDFFETFAEAKAVQITGEGVATIVLIRP